MGGNGHAVKSDPCGQSLQLMCHDLGLDQRRQKKHRDIMAVQILSQFFCGASSIALKGYSSTAQNAAVFRLKGNEKAMKLAFILNMLMYAVFSAVILD